MGKHRLWLAAAFTALGMAGSPAGAETDLLMFEQPGCVYCARFDAEIAPAYPLTWEGRAAPLRRLPLRGPIPDGFSLTSPAVFTPTFVLVEDGSEVGRIEGYPGEDFFWSLLGGLLAKAGLADDDG